MEQKKTKNSAASHKEKGNIMNINDLNQKPQIDFPCKWSYKVFGSDKDKVENAINEVLTKHPYQIIKSTKSSKGNYISLTIKLTIVDQNELDLYYNTLSKHKDIKIVL